MLVPYGEMIERSSAGGGEAEISAIGGRKCESALRVVSTDGYFRRKARTGAAS